MKKTAVIYWSGTGNTEAMANAVLEGMKSAGAEASLLTVDQVNAADLGGYAAIAFGCPAMGSEVLEEMEFQPMFCLLYTSVRHPLHHLRPGGHDVLLPVFRHEEVHPGRCADAGHHEPAHLSLIHI